MDEPDQGQPPPRTLREAASLAERHLPALRLARGVPVRFVGGGEEAPGVFRLAQPTVDSRVYLFVDECIRDGWSFPFDWISFADRAREMIDREDGIESASLDELRRLLTVIIRQDRFGRGVVEEMAERGAFVRILERMAALAAPVADPSGTS
jgi:hypothetical protein